jgi:carbon starvation protein CstA
VTAAMGVVGVVVTVVVVMVVVGSGDAGYRSSRFNVAKRLRKSGGKLCTATKRV